jgi:spore germination cell wall hydrolase CwlJ-like protein
LSPRYALPTGGGALGNALTDLQGAKPWGFSFRCIEDAHMGHFPPLSDHDYLALCIWDEARGEAALGQVAVGQVVLNRARTRYSSDGTIRGTVLAPNQFSGFYFDFVDGRYQRVCHDINAADLRAHSLLARAVAEMSWPRCGASADAALGGSGDAVGPDAVLYYNPAVVHMPPPWATHDKYLKTIGHHAFYRA